jgi:hypothetical protein
LTVPIKKSIKSLNFYFFSSEEKLFDNEEINCWWSYSDVAFAIVFRKEALRKKQRKQ